MICRRCRMEIPEGSRHCEYCGTFQQTYIVIHEQRDSSSKSKKIIVNAVVLMLITAIIIGAIVIAATMSEGNRKQHLEDIRERYSQLASETAPSEAALESFNIMVARYVAKYPKSEELDEVKKYHAEINHYDPELTAPQNDAELEDLKAQERYLIENAKSTILQIGDIYCSERQDSGDFNLVINWANNSSKNVDSVSFLVEAYDESGDVVKNSEDKSRLSASTTTGPFKTSSSDSYYQNIWMSVWPAGSEISSIKLVQVKLYYEDGSTIVLNENITPHLK